MPCTDISEVGKASFAPDAGLVAYELRKGTCGAPVAGSRLLKKLFYGKSPDAIAHLPWSEIEAVLSPRNLVTNFDERKLSYSIWVLCREYLGLPNAAENLEILLIDYEPDGSLTLLHTIDFEKGLPIEGCSTKCHNGGCK